MTNDPEKSCAKCGESWPATTEFFYRERRTRDGLRAMCKACYHDLPSVKRRQPRREEAA